MQMKDAFELQKEWKRKGNPHCTHPNVEREYHLGSHTGDNVCTTCGAYVNLEKSRRKSKKKA
jgi:hypothetical protein